MASKPGPCKKCGIVFEGKYCKPCDNARSAARRKADPKAAVATVREWKKKNPERASQLNKISYERNKESIAARAREYRRKHRQRLDAYNREYDQKNPEVRANIWRRRSKKDVAELSDKYVRHLLRIKGAPIPSSLVEAKRLTIQIKRLIKERK